MKRRCRLPLGRYLSVVGLLTVCATPIYAQADVGYGRQVYAKTCANQNCHGAAGPAGVAPAIAGRGLPLDRLTQILRQGVPNTSMPGWETTLTLEDFQAVLSYALSIQQVAAARREESLDPKRPWLGHKGRELFFDSNRITPCGSCHSFDGLGLAVAPKFEAIPTMSAGELRKLSSEKVVTLRYGPDEAFHAIATSARSGTSRWYDLSAELPVLRTFDDGEILVDATDSWSHDRWLVEYNDAELDTVLDFLKQALAE